MNDQRRFRDGEDSFLRTLVLAGREEAPSGAELRRVLGLAGIAAGVTTASAAGAAAGAVKSALGASAIGGLALAKWTLVGVTAGLITTTAVHRLQAPLDPPEPSAPDTVALPGVARAEPSPSQLDPAPLETPDPRPQPLQRTDSSPLARSAVAAASSGPSALADEVQRLERARRLLQQGDGAASLGELDRYHREHASPALAVEATFLRMQALEARGDSAGARAMAERLLELAPDGPQAARARAVLGQEGGSNFE